MNPEQFFNFRNFCEEFITWVSDLPSSLLRCPDENCLKNRPETCGFADWQFISLKYYPDRFFSSLKKTIVLYLVQKFETVVVILTSGRKRVFLTEKLFVSAFRTVHFILNLQAEFYRNINYYQIFICYFTPCYLSF